MLRFKINDFLVATISAEPVLYSYCPLQTTSKGLTLNLLLPKSDF